MIWDPRHGHFWLRRGCGCVEASIKLRRRLAKIAGRAEVDRTVQRAKTDQKFILRTSISIEAHRFAGRIVAGKLAWRFDPGFPYGVRRTAQNLPDLGCGDRAGAQQLPAAIAAQRRNAAFKARSAGPAIQYQRNLSGQRCRDMLRAGWADPA